MATHLDATSSELLRLGNVGVVRPAGTAGLGVTFVDDQHHVGPMLVRGANLVVPDMVERELAGR